MVPITYVIQTFEGPYQKYTNFIYQLLLINKVIRGSFQIQNDYVHFNTFRETIIRYLGKEIIYHFTRSRISSFRHPEVRHKTIFWRTIKSVSSIHQSSPKRKGMFRTIVFWYFITFHFLVSTKKMIFIAIRG